MKKANKITTAEHNDNFYLVTAGVLIGMAMLSAIHLMVTVVMGV